MNVEEFRILDIPGEAYYIPNFISEEEEKRTLDQISKTSKVKWTQLSNRRLQNWGGIPHPKGMIAEELPPWLATHVRKVNQLEGVFPQDKAANHVLLNEYLPGDGILPHLDGPLFYPTITTVNLGSRTLLDFYEPLDGDKGDWERSQLNERYMFSILTEPRSLLILREDLYKKYLHGIRESTHDEVTAKVVQPPRGYAIGEKLERGTRISLTIRHVPNTKKLKIRL